MHINAAGANSLTRRELDNSAVTKSSVIVTDAIDKAKIEVKNIGNRVEPNVRDDTKLNGMNEENEDRKVNKIEISTIVLIKLRIRTVI